MEILGVVASGIALVEVASKVTRLATRTVLHLRDAPHELNGLRDKVSLLEAQLHQIASVQLDMPIPALVLESLQRALSVTEKAIRLVLVEVTTTDQKVSGVRSMMKWALIKRHTVQNLEYKLQEAHQFLVVQLSLLNVHFHNETVRTHIRVRDEIMLAISQLKHLEEKKWDSHVQPTYLGLRHIERAGCLSNASKREIITTKSSQVAAWLLFLGFRGTILSKRMTSSTAFRVSIKFRLPSCWGFTKRVIVAEFTFHLKRSYCIPRFHVQAFNVVDEDAAIMVACEQGSVIEVRRLLQHREASVFDMTLSNYSPLYYAILSGSVELVELLLAQHTDLANHTFGFNETSPLQLALLHRRLRICRTLLGHNASPCYINSIGRTPIFYLAIPRYGDETPERACVTDDFYSLLFGDSLFLDLEVQDVSGYTVLEHVAAYGTADAVTALLRLGADLPSRWLDGNAPMACAISNGNLSTFKALLPYYPDIEQSGLRGFTMLGYAAYSGSDCIMRHLLYLGAIEPLFECNHTPELGGPGLPPQLYEQYLQTLEECERIIIKKDESDDSLEREIYWDANEENEWVEG